MDSLSLNYAFDYLSTVGFDFSPELRLIFQSSLLSLQSSHHLTHISLWGRIDGTKGDYFICSGVGSDFIKDRVYFYSNGLNLDWTLLPAPSEISNKLCLNIKNRLVGEVGEKVFCEFFEPDELEMEEDGEWGSLSEEEFLGSVVSAITREGFALPRGALLKTPDGVVKINNEFSGHNKYNSCLPISYCHYDFPDSLWDEKVVGRADYNLAVDFLRSLGSDVPTSSWAIQLNSNETVAVLNSLYWPGAVSYHVLNSSKYGSFYLGTGRKNWDLPFMLPPIPFELPLSNRKTECILVNDIQYCGESETLDTPVKLKLDKREYRGLLLSNKLRVVLISDPTTDVSAASLAIGAGSLMDPKEFLGLAHFCEHMVFLGNEKFPSEEDFQMYLAENGGSRNASTYLDVTNFFFDAEPKALYGGLLRFAQMFICPLLKESCAEREVNAVHSEHEKNIPQEIFIKEQIEALLVDQSTPFAQFTTGTRETLWTKPKENKLSVRDALLNFFKKYYTSSIMNLTILGVDPIDKLEEMAVEHFGSIINTGLELPIWTLSPFGPNELGYQIIWVPVNDIRELTIMFPFSDISKEYRSFSEDYLSKLIGSEAPGSLVSFLRTKSLLCSFNACTYHMARGVPLFRFDLRLTSDGIKKINEIILHIFQYLEMLRKEGPQKWYWEEMTKMELLELEYKDQQSPYEYVTSISFELYRYKMADILTHGLQSPEYKPDLITEILNKLTPENLVMHVCSKEYEGKTESCEPYYGTPYTKNKICEEAIKMWKECGLNDEFKFISPNPFIPTNIKMKSHGQSNGKVPKLLVDSPLTKLWFLQDSEFSQPKGVIYTEFYSPLADESPLSFNLNELFVQAVKDLLKEEGFYAREASLSYTIQNSVYGVEVNVEGFDEKLPDLLHLIISKMTNFTLSEERFKVLKEEALCDLNNHKNNTPYSLVRYYLDILLNEKKWSIEDRLGAMDGVTFESLRNYATDFAKNLKFETFVFGNFTEKETISISKSIEDTFLAQGTQPISSELKRYTELKIPIGTNYMHETEYLSSNDSCAGVYFQTSFSNDVHDYIADELIESMLKDPCFDQLRTKEQLGYIVSTWIRHKYGTIGILIRTQSGRHPHYVDSRIENFLHIFHESLKNMSEEHFSQHLHSFITRKLVKPKGTVEKAEKIWDEILKHEYKFDRVEEEVEALKKIDHKTLLARFEKKFALNAPERKRLSIHIVSSKGAKHEEVTDILKLEKIANVEEWRKAQEML